MAAESGVVAVVANDAELLDRSVLPDDAYVVVADGGADAALAWGIVPDLLIGDCDSISREALEDLEAFGVEVEHHRRGKDQTDLELALAAALRRSPSRILVFASPAGRLDHLLGSVFAVAAAASPTVEVDAVFGSARINVVVSRRVLEGAPGELVSLFAVGGETVGVSTRGLRYPLRGETLSPLASRGVSNEFEAPRVEISVGQGRLLVVRPGAV